MTRVVESLITLDDVRVNRGSAVVLSSITLTVPAGGVVGVAGPNGTGKTTLLRLIATLIQPASGSGTVLGGALGTSEIFKVRGQIGLISHEPAVIPGLTLKENLTHTTRLSGLDESRVEPALRVVGLEEASNRLGQESSFGMLRRTEIARLLISRPRLVLLDEAYGGLDDAARSLIDVLIERTSDGGGAVVIVSHDPSQMEPAQSLFRLDSGTLVSQS